MENEKVLELLEEIKSIVILLENDLYTQKQDPTTINAVKVIHHLLNELETALS